MTKKLLLADDSITIQKVIGIIFATEDYQLIVTDNGDEAFEKALHEYPDLVIADISMPGKNGFELCEAIKSDPRLPHTSVLLLPGTFEHFDEERAQAVGADGWINKPFESQSFLAKVAQLLEVEPIRLDGGAAPEAEPAAESELVLTEENLSLDTMDEPTGHAVADGEESPEDIWDAVSFEEEDLQETEPTGSQDGSTADASGVDFSGAEDLVLEESPGFSAPFEAAEETPLELVEEEPSAETDLDFSPEEEERFEPGGEEIEPAEEASAFDEESVELIEEIAAPEEDFSPVEEITQEEPLELAEEEPLELAEPDVDTESSFLAGPEPADVEPVEEDIIPLTEPLEEEVFDEEEEILDLGVEDIIEDEPLADESVDEPLADESVDEPVLLAEEEELAEMDGPVAFVEEEFAEVLEEPFEPEVEEQTVAQEESPFVAGLEEDVTEEQIEVEPEVAEDEGFFFDDAVGEEVEDTTEPEPAAVLSAVSAGASIELAEMQLRALSAEELKEVVSKVAGPMIEKLASEMLAQIAWEVVPDLAEAMIREEIRKIKQGTE